MRVIGSVRHRYLWKDCIILKEGCVSCFLCDRVELEIYCKLPQLLFWYASCGAETVPDMSCLEHSVGVRTKPSMNSSVQHMSKASTLLHCMSIYNRNCVHGIIKI
jgi:hypothetical protein